jgi:ribonuclease HI
MSIFNQDVEIFTDGACKGNPGPGGYGVVLTCNGYEKEISGGEPNTTNNRMEITAVIVALESLKKRCKVTLYSDSKYLVDSINKGWVEKWKKQNWWRTKKEKALNIDLWKRLLLLIDKHDVNFVWVKGHVGNVKNERCDKLATEMACFFNKNS